MHICTIMYTYLVCKKKSFQRAYLFFKTKPKTAFLKMRKQAAVLHCIGLGDPGSAIGGVTRYKNCTENSEPRAR